MATCSVIYLPDQYVAVVQVLRGPQSPADARFIPADIVAQDTPVWNITLYILKELCFTDPDLSERCVVCTHAFPHPLVARLRSFISLRTYLSVVCCHICRPWSSICLGRRSVQYFVYLRYVRKRYGGKIFVSARVADLALRPGPMLVGNPRNFHWFLQHQLQCVAHWCTGTIIGRCAGPNTSNREMFTTMFFIRRSGHDLYTEYFHNVRQVPECGRQADDRVIPAGFTSFTGYTSPVLMCGRFGSPELILFLLTMMGHPGVFDNAVGLVEEVSRCHLKPPPFLVYRGIFFARVVAVGVAACLQVEE